MILLQLFFEFFKVGLFSIGGGLATLPFLYDISNTLGWFTHGDIANMIAIAESTPGAIGINMSTYAGYQVDGILGGIVATIGLITPSVIILSRSRGLGDVYKRQLYTLSKKTTWSPIILVAISAVVGIVLHLGGA